MNDTVVQEFLFANYVELNSKKCLAYAYCVAVFGFLFIVSFTDKFYRIFTISVSSLVVIWIVFLLFSKRRSQPEYKFANDGIILAHFSLQFLYVGYVLIGNEEKPFVLLLLFLIWVCCIILYYPIIKRRMKKGTKKYSKFWNYISPLAGVIGYFGASAIMPHFESTAVVKMAVILMLFLAYFLIYFCVTNFYKAILVQKYHITKPV